MADKYYIELRKKLGLSREKASERMVTISPEKLEKIENEKQDPTPADIMELAQAYQDPAIPNYYCAHKCRIGQCYIPEVEFKELEKTVLQMIASLNAMHAMQERLIAISADGKIDDNEIKDFITIQKELDRIALAAASMQLWTEKMMSTGVIDMEKYNTILKELDK